MPAAASLPCLVVDDQMTMRSLVRTSLQQLGVREIREAADGEIALRDLVEIRLLRLKGRGHWRLRSASGEALLVNADMALYRAKAQPGSVVRFDPSMQAESEARQMLLHAIASAQSSPGLAWASLRA